MPRSAVRPMTGHERTVRGIRLAGLDFWIRLWVMLVGLLLRMLESWQCGRACFRSIVRALSFRKRTGECYLGVCKGGFRCGVERSPIVEFWEVSGLSRRISSALVFRDILWAKEVPQGGFGFLFWSFFEEA